MKFCAAHVCAKYREEHGTSGSCMSFDTCESRILMQSVPLPRFGIFGADGFEMSYLIDILLFR